jgi:hypothetical protein
MMLSRNVAFQLVSLSTHIPAGRTIFFCYSGPKLMAVQNQFEGANAIGPPHKTAEAAQFNRRQTIPESGPLEIQSSRHGDKR